MPQNLEHYQQLQVVTRATATRAVATTAAATRTTSVKVKPGKFVLGQRELPEVTANNLPQRFCQPLLTLDASSPYF